MRRKNRFLISRKLAASITYSYPLGAPHEILFLYKQIRNWLYNAPLRETSHGR
jgi:hypothetical protein